jgi:hypothetical protein
MWTDFFVAAAGASAALAGLVFVALSVNLNQITRFPQLALRAAATIAMLMLILVCSMVALIPQRMPALGFEIIVFGVFGCWLQIASAKRGYAAVAQFNRPKWESVVNAVTGLIQIAPFIIGGILFLDARDGAFYWIGAGCVTIFILSALNAWVLLVEILR